MFVDQLPDPLNRLGSKDSVTRHLTSGEALFTQGSTTSGLYFVQSGEIILSRTTDSGHSVVIHRARSTDTFAEASLFSDVYHCSATAGCASVVIECRKSATRKLLNDNPDFTLSMLERLAKQLQTSRRQVELLSIKKATDRVLAALTDGLLGDDINSFADTIGLAPETVYRTLAQLTNEGKINKTSRGKYQLPNPNVLTR